MSKDTLPWLPDKPIEYRTLAEAGLSGACERIGVLEKRYVKALESLKEMKRPDFVCSKSCVCLDRTRAYVDKTIKELREIE